MIRVDDFERGGTPPVECDHVGAGEKGCEVCDDRLVPEYTWPVSEEWQRVSQLRKNAAYLDGVTIFGKCHNGAHPRMLHKHSMGSWYSGSEAEGFA